MPDWVDAEPVRAYVRQLQQTMSDAEIARAARVRREQVYVLLNDTAYRKPVRRMRADRAAAFLAIEPPQLPILLLSVGMRRRLEALTN